MQRTHTEPIAQPQRVSPGDTVLVTTSGHSPASSDTACSVVEVVERTAEHLFLHLRLPNGRDLFYVPALTDARASGARRRHAPSAGPA